jgi:putative ABC transport system permease protein
MSTAASAPSTPSPARSAAAGSLINVLALGLGLAALLLILAFLSAELSWDRMHHNFDRIYRVTEAFKLRDQAVKFGALSPLVMADTLHKEWPEIAAAGRIMPILEGTSAGKVAVRQGSEKQLYEYFSWADPSILQIFTLPFVTGDARTALAAPNSVIVSEAAARKLFGATPAVGRTLKIDSGYSDENYQVTGVFKDQPFNSHFHLQIVASFASLDHVKDPRILRTQFWVSDTYTYVLLAPGASIQTARARFPAFVAKHFQKIEGAQVTLFLQSLGDIHLRSHQLFEFEPNGDIKTVRVLAWAAGATLLILILNFMALSTARYPRGASTAALSAAREAGRGRLFRRLFGESLALAVIALILAVILVQLALPPLNGLTGEAVTLPVGPAAWGFALALVLVASLAAAAYATWCLMACVAGGDLGTAAVAGGSGRVWRTALAGVQVAAGVALLVAAGVVHDQLRFVRAFNLGFDMNDVIVVPIRDVGLRDHYAVLKATMERIPGVVGTTFSSLVLGQQPPEVGTFLGGAKAPKDLATLVTDHDFVKVLRIGLVAGRAFSAQVPTDQPAGFIVNEAALRLWGLPSPQASIGQTLNWNTIKKGAVVGVVHDFHNQPLQVGVEPLLMHIRPIAFRYMYLRLAPRDTAATLRAVAAAWRGLVADKPFDSFLLADYYGRSYRGERELAGVLAHAALLVLIVALLVLAGLAAFTGEARRGQLAAASSTSRAALVLGRALAAPVVVAWLLGCLLAWWVMTHWLAAHFAEHTGVHPVLFLTGALAALVVTVLALIAPAARAAREARAGA